MDNTIDHMTESKSQTKIRSEKGQHICPGSNQPIMINKIIDSRQREANGKAMINYPCGGGGHH